MPRKIVKSNAILVNEGFTQTSLKLGTDIAEAPPTAAPVTIGDLYRRVLSRATKLTKMSKDDSQAELLRSHFRDRAFDLESNAGYLAHCVDLQ